MDFVCLSSASLAGNTAITLRMGILAEAGVNAFYLTLGVIVGRYHGAKKISCIQIGWLLIIVGVGLSVSSLGGVLEFPDRYELGPILALSGIAATVALAVLTDKAQLDAAVLVLGQYSLQIYVVHAIAAAGVRIALLDLIHVSAPAPHLVLGILAGLYLPISLALVFDRVGFHYGFTIPSCYVARTMSEST